MRTFIKKKRSVRHALAHEPVTSARWLVGFLFDIRNKLSVFTLQSLSVCVYCVITAVCGRVSHLQALLNNSPFYHQKNILFIKIVFLKVMVTATLYTKVFYLSKWLFSLGNWFFIFYFIGTFFEGTTKFHCKMRHFKKS